MKDQKPDFPRHPIGIVARRTGLTPAVLRAWERRYGVVLPLRTEGGQRHYSDDDVLRLSLLRRATEGGRRISQVALFSMEQLQRLVTEDEAQHRGSWAPGPPVGLSAVGVLERAQRAVEEMNSGELERILTRGAMGLPLTTVLENVIVPLLGGMGTAWEKGRIGPAHEHLASVSIRRFLEWALGTVDEGKGAPVLLAATPAGERHELGALLSAVSGAAEGWKGIFLGPDLPAEEIVSAAIKLEVRLVALACFDPSTRQALPGEIMKIRRELPADIYLVLGGPLAVSEEEALMAEGVEVLGTLEGFRANLRELGFQR